MKRPLLFAALLPLLPPGDRLAGSPQSSGSRALALAHAKLDEILSRREFRFGRGPSEAETFWARLKNWVWQWFSKLLSRAGAHPHLTDILLWGTVVVLSLVFMGWLISALMQMSSRRGSLPLAAAPAGPWRQEALEARDAAARGDFREAIRLIYGAAVVLLGQAGAWQVDPARTHREYVRLLPSGSARLPHLLAITLCFEKVWYGGAPASARDYETARAELERLA